MLLYAHVLALARMSEPGDENVLELKYRSRKSNNLKRKYNAHQECIGERR